MTIREKLEKLATERNTPCVTISQNTHRTHPDNAQDGAHLNNLLREAEKRVLIEFEKRKIQPLLERISKIEKDINVNYNLDSLHIYLSNDTEEIIRSEWVTNDDGVHISDAFNLRSLIKSYERSEEYYILLVSQSGVNLYNAMNENIIDEVLNDDFPFGDNRLFISTAKIGGDSKQLDDKVREFLNRVDKAVMKMHNETGLNCVVICTEDNYSRLMQVADNPSIYHGYASIDYNNTATHSIAKQSWEIVKAFQRKRRGEAIAEVKESVAQGAVLTDLQEIFQASIDGRGDVLIVHQDFSQPVVMTGDRTFELAIDKTMPKAIDDITSKIAWEVLSKKGEVFFTMQDEIKELGDIVLKTRY